LKYAAGLAGGLLQAGASPALLTRDHALEFGGDLGELHAHVEGLSTGEVPLWTLPGRMRELRALPEMRTLARRRRRFAPDVIHLQEATEDDPRLLLVTGLRRRRYAYTVHDPVVHPGDSQPPRHAQVLRRLLLRHAGLVFVHAESLRDELERSAHVSGPIEIVPHGTTIPEIQSLPARPSILFFGRISAYKGLDVLLDSMQAIWDQVPAARLVIAGEGDLPDHPRLSDERVELRHGHVPETDIPSLFADAMLVVLPYIQASQSGVGSLAKSHGRAMVVTSVGGLPELVDDDSGLVVAPSDAEALAAAVSSLLLDPDRTTAMGLAGAQTAAGAGSWRAVGDATLAAYEKHGLI
jgi:glycosyltransferase involved in cell wall biosynthesis